MKIPKSFKLFASTFNVVFDNQRMDDQNAYGITEHERFEITLSDCYNGKKLSKDTIVDTFYHEKVHAILVAMNEHKLNKNEPFIDVFAKLLRQSDETAKY